MNYIHSYTEAAYAEEMIPSMTYTGLLESLGRLTDLGLIAPENPVTMLVVARIVDRTRILRSGVSAAEVRFVLESYRRRKPVDAVVHALERALETLQELENEGQSAAHRAW
jgi:hypothetical protein